MKLFEIIAEIENCIKYDDDRVVNVESGEVIDIEALDALKIERDTKIENIGCWIKNLKSDVVALKAEKDAMAAREKAAKNKIEQLESYLALCLAGKPFKTAKVAITYRKSEAVEFDSAYFRDVPEEFLKFKDPELDKTAVKKAIKDGQTVPGCQLVVRQNMQVK